MLIVSVGVAGAFAANAVSFLIFLFALSRLRLNETPQSPRDCKGASVLAELRDGIGYTLGHPGIGPMLFLLATLSLGVRPFIDLMPGFAAEVFGGGVPTAATPCRLGDDMDIKSLRCLVRRKCRQLG